MSDPKQQTPYRNDEQDKHDEQSLAAKLADRGVFRPASDFSGFARRGYADQLSIDTPEQVALTFPVAGIGSRFVALLLDTLIQAGVVLAAGLVLAVLFAALGRHGDMLSLAGKWFIAFVLFAFFLLFWGYFSLFEAFWHGQTPGKRVMKLRVIKDSGRGVTLFESLARNLLRIVDYLPGLYLAGVVTMLANKRNKRLGDLAAGTLVIHERPDSQPLLYTGPSGSGNFFAPAQPWEAAAQPSTSFAADSIARLSPHDLVVIEAFFARALDLPLEVRDAMAQRILTEMARKMNTAAPAGNPERILEAIATGLRKY